MLLLTDITPESCYILDLTYASKDEEEEGRTGWMDE